MDITHNGIGMNEELDDSLILVHQNIRGLSSKISEFTSVLTLDNINPQFLCFSECHMSESNLCLINPENYNLGTSFCCQTYQKGGACTYVRKDVYYKSLDLTRYCEEKHLEICAIQIESVTNQQIIVCVYRSPSGNFHQFLRLFEIMLMSLYRPKTEFVICGDVNTNYLSDSSRKHQLSQLFSSFNMLHTLNFPTRFQHNHSSAIDIL
jgi:exonuclease III